jgi:hypothetical protein
MTPIKASITAILILICVLNTKANAQDSTMAEVIASTFIVHKDPRLDALNNRAKLMAEAIMEKEEANLKPKNSMPVYQEINVGKKKVTGSIVEKNGFRIVIFNGADKATALKVKNGFIKAYPGTKSYLSYNAPNFKIKVGDFDDKKDANAFLKNILKYYPNAFLTPDIVTVKNILVQ